MSTKRLKPDTPSRRFNVVPTFDEITKSKPERKLTVALRKQAEEIIMEKLPLGEEAVDIKEDIEL